tara:strand:+ start:4524 stop:4913 length:390 start_codon:yes stop_codon:yes gene_type:complete
MSNIIEKLISPVSSILDKFIVDKDLKEKLEHELKTELHKANMAQVEINKIEAGHRSIFVAGWRPFLGWCLSFAMAYHFIIQPIAVFSLSIAGLSYDLPQFDMNSLMTVLLGMLGLGGMRTYEKSKGITK